MKTIWNVCKAIYHMIMGVLMFFVAIFAWLGLTNSAYIIAKWKHKHELTHYEAVGKYLSMTSARWNALMK